MRLTPGVDVSDRVLAAIDANGDGVISEAEQQAYAEHVSRDLSLKIDGYPLQIRLVSSTFPKLEEIKEGLGEILLNIEAHLPKGLAADYAAALLSDRGKVAQLEGEPASQTAQLRKKGFHEEIAKYQEHPTGILDHRPLDDAGRGRRDGSHSQGES